MPVSVSKKAVVRNRIKRIFFSALEEIFPSCRPGIDLVIVVSSSAVKKTIYEISRSLEEIFIKANIVESN